MGRGRPRKTLAYELGKFMVKLIEGSVTLVVGAVMFTALSSVGLLPDLKPYVPMMAAISMFVFTAYIFRDHMDVGWSIPFISAALAYLSFRSEHLTMSLIDLSNGLLILAVAFDIYLAKSFWEKKDEKGLMLLILGLALIVGGVLNG